MQREEVAALNPRRYGLLDDEQKYDVNGIVWTSPVGAGSGTKDEWTLGAITQHLRSIYVGRIAYEYMHSPSKTERLWFSHLLESQSPSNVKMSKDQKTRIYSLLAQSETFDQFLQLKFPNLKRYGLEGGESMLPALDVLFAAAARGVYTLVFHHTVLTVSFLAAGVEDIILAMPHRGRLNLLTDLLKLPHAALFHKIRGGADIPEHLGASGDVISHLGRCRHSNIRTSCSRSRSRFTEAAIRRCTESCEGFSTAKSFPPRYFSPNFDRFTAHNIM